MCSIVYGRFKRVSNSLSIIPNYYELLGGKRVSFHDMFSIARRRNYSNLMGDKFDCDDTKYQERQIVKVLKRDIVNFTEITL